ALYLRGDPRSRRARVKQVALEECMGTERGHRRVASDERPRTGSAPFIRASGGKALADPDRSQDARPTCWRSAAGRLGAQVPVGCNARLGSTCASRRTPGGCHLPSLLGAGASDAEIDLSMRSTAFVPESVSTHVKFR